MAVRVERGKEVNGGGIVLQVKLLASRREQHEGKEQKGNTEQKVADEAPTLGVDEHDADKKGWEDDHAQVDIEAKRHDPRREGGADVGSHDDGNGLGEGQKAGVDKAHRHYGGSGRRLNGTGDKHSCEHSRKTIGGHSAQNAAQL